MMAPRIEENDEEEPIHRRIDDEDPVRGGPVSVAGVVKKYGISDVTSYARANGSGSSGG